MITGTATGSYSTIEAGVGEVSSLITVSDVPSAPLPAEKVVKPRSGFGVAVGGCARLEAAATETGCLSSPSARRGSFEVKAQSGILEDEGSCEYPGDVGSLPCRALVRVMDVVLNESTETVHRRKAGGSDRHTVCGITRSLDPETFQTISVELAATEYAADKCGRCFDGEGGY